MHAEFDPDSAVPVEENEDESYKEESMEEEHEKMMELCASLEKKIADLERQVHKLASRPPTKDNTPALIAAFKEANEKICEAIRAK